MNILIKFLHKHKFIYKLSSEERITFNKLLNTVLLQLLKNRQRTYFSFNNIEGLLLDKIHAHFYGKDWYISDSIGCKEVDYILFNDIRNKLIF